MKILIATGIYPPQIGGPATYAKLLYDELPKRGIDVEVVTFGDYLGKPKIIRHFFYFMELVRKASDVDLIYALDPVSVGLPALFASQIRGKKFFLRIAGDYAWEQGTQRFGVTDNLDDFVKTYDKYPWQVKLFQKIEKYVADGAKKIIVPSTYLRGIVSAWDIDVSKMSVIYNGFHIESLRETPSVLRKKLHLSGSIIVSVGRLVSWKGMKELIEIMPAIIALVPLAQLVIVGDGPEKNNLEETARAFGLGDRVIFTDRLIQQKVFEYVKAADLFVLNTSYEGFSHQIIETMALGTPVITTAVGGNSEIIRNNENGILISPGAKESLLEATVGLLLDPKRAESLAEIAKRDVEKFTDEMMLSNIAKELQKN
ncbi:MAG: glycosyltransferase family 4 protein [bacterium]|nr:glycosyltransferase family 4 protein [bacterium]